MQLTQNNPCCVLLPQNAGKYTGMIRSKCVKQYIFKNQWITCVYPACDVPNAELARWHQYLGYGSACCWWCNATSSGPYLTSL